MKVFRLRPEHEAAFEKAAVEDFEIRAAANLRHFLPSATEGQDDSQLYELLREAQRKAEPHGLISELDITRYAGVMLMLGNEFEQDARHDWCRVVLQSDKPANLRSLVLLENAQNLYEIQR